MEETEFEFEFERWAPKSKERIIAEGEEIDDIVRLTEFYGGDQAGWKKVKRDACGTVDEEQEVDSIHWYKHKDVGCVDYKCKDLLASR